MLLLAKADIYVVGEPKVTIRPADFRTCGPTNGYSASRPNTYLLPGNCNYLVWPHQFRGEDVTNRTWRTVSPRRSLRFFGKYPAMDICPLLPECHDSEAVCLKPDGTDGSDGTDKYR